jgi:hypothetical protein
MLDTVLQAVQFLLLGLVGALILGEVGNRADAARLRRDRDRFRAQYRGHYRR